MPQIRTKTITVLYWDYDQHGSRYTASYTDTIPIRDWSANPTQIRPAAWTAGAPDPVPVILRITFPEMDYVTNPDEFPGGFRFKIRKNFSGVDFIEITSDNGGITNNVFNKINTETETVKVNFRNLENLPAGVHQMDFVIEAYGLDLQGNETFVEDSNIQDVTVSVKLTVLSGSGFGTDKNSYNLTYNKADGSLSGDAQIIVYSAQAVTFSTANPYITLQQVPSTSEQYLRFQVNPDLAALAVGSYASAVTITRGTQSKTVTVNLSVINDGTQFYVNPTALKTSIQKNLNESKTLTVQLSNPNKLNVAVDLAPSFIESVTIQEGNVRVITKNSSELALGNYAGDIILKAGSVQKMISVNLSVLQAVVHDFVDAPYYFALDRNRVIVNKTHPDATHVKMTLQMYFKGYGRQEQERQEYTYPFFRSAAEIYPGEDIQDFFIKTREPSMAMGQVHLYDLALVKMTFEEVTASGVVSSIFSLENVRFAPGRRPRCFPFFTDYPVRSTYSESKINVIHDCLSNPPGAAELQGQYTQDFGTTVRRAGIGQYTFYRNKFDPKIRVITAELLKFIPLPDEPRPVHIEWETQNLVFDWFTAVERTKEIADIENIVGESRQYREEKYDSQVTKTLIVNSGWILEEEIDLITDMLRSRLCFLTIGGRRIKAFPVGQKNEMKDSDNNLFSMDLEFKILTEK